MWCGGEVPCVCVMCGGIVCGVVVRCRVCVCVMCGGILCGVVVRCSVCVCVCDVWWYSVWCGGEVPCVCVCVCV